MRLDALMDDHHLLAKASAGDQLAIEELVRRHAPLVLAACRRQLPASDADDAAQAVFLVLWRRSARAAAASSLPAWLVVTARLVCANARRAAIRRHQAESTASGPGLSESIANEARALLDEALAALPSAERAAVVQRHFLGEDPATVAIALGCAEGTVHSRTSRGLERMRAWFARRGIACTASALLLLCAEERAAAAALPAATLEACATPSSAAFALAAATTTAIPLVLIGVLFMTITTFVLAGTLFLWPVVVATASETPAPPKPMQMTRLFDVRDLCLPEVDISGMGMTRTPILPKPDPAVETLDACRNLRWACFLVQSLAGPDSIVRLVDASLPDEDLQECLPHEPSTEPASISALRKILLNGGEPPIPRLDAQRTLLVTTDASRLDLIEATLRAVSTRRRDRLKADTALMTAGEDFARAVHGSYGIWFMPSATAPKVVSDPAPAALPTTGGAHRFAIIWLPEVRQPSPGILFEPIAVATDGTCSLIAAAGGRILWRPDLRPAAIALFLRQHLDQGTYHAPLIHEHWLEAANVAMLEDGVGHRELYRDLSEIVRVATKAAPSGF